MATHVTSGAPPHVSEPLTKRNAWKALQTHYERVRALHLRELFA